MKKETDISRPDPIISLLEQKCMCLAMVVVRCGISEEKLKDHT
jgi:lambda repressor-like predicted transcriptional regulator